MSAGKLRAHSAPFTEADSFDWTSLDYTATGVGSRSG